MHFQHITSMLQIIRRPPCHSLLITLIQNFLVAGLADWNDDTAVLREGECEMCMKGFFGDHYLDYWMSCYDDFLVWWRPEAGQSRRSNPWLVVLGAHIEELAKPRGDGKFRLKVFGTDLKCKFKTNSADNKSIQDLCQEWYTDVLYVIHKPEPLAFNSFALPKPWMPGKVRFFNCGAEYFENLADAIMSAKQSIFITDWWLSPTIYLKRRTLPPPQEYRLDNLLQSRAQAGVSVYVLIWKLARASPSVRG